MKNSGMQLKEAQTLLSRPGHGPESALASVKDLKACAERAITYLEEGNTLRTQIFLEQGFTSLLRAFHFLNLDLEKVVDREKRRQKNAESGTQERVILVFSNHAELRVEGELRGTIPLYTDEDYAELRQIAHLFECRMEHADHLQLNIFEKQQSQSRPA